MPRLLLLGSLLILLTQGCANFRGKDGADGLARNLKAPRLIKDLETNVFRPQYLEASGRIKLESDKLNIGGTATIRLIEGEAIWVSVRKFGLEGARALIRPDSFFVYNRLQGEYTAEPLEYIERKFNVPARFDLLQEMILGNAVFFTRDLKLSQNEELYELRGEDRRYATEYIVDGRGLLLKQMNIRELADGREISIQNADYQPVDGQERKFPHSRTVRVNTQEAGEAIVQLGFNRVTLGGPLDMPFRQR